MLICVLLICFAFLCVVDGGFLFLYDLLFIVVVCVVVADLIVLLFLV